MNFPEAIKSGFKNYFNFNGRASRAEFWYWTLFTSLCVTLWVAVLLSYVKILHNPMEGPVYFALYSSILVFAMIIMTPSYAVGARRFHDMNRTGWWQLIILIPYVGAITYFLWCAFEGTPGSNRFGSNPLGEPDLET